MKLFSFRAIRYPVVAFAFVAAVSSGARAADTLAQIKQLYQSAAYEQVIAAAGNPEVDSAAAGPEYVNQVREFLALSFLALNQTEKADKVIEDILTANPRYATADDAPPRWTTEVEQVRVRVRPKVILARYTAAKAHFDAKEFPQATADFQTVLDLLKDTPIETQKSELLADLPTLTRGFLELSRAQAPPPQPAPPAASPTSDDGEIVPPVAVRQDLPHWVPPPSLRQARFKGKLEVLVGPDGTVQSAHFITPVQPSYDQMVLAATRSWLYQPATKNGKPIAFRRVIEIELKP